MRSGEKDRFGFGRGEKGMLAWVSWALENGSSGSMDWGPLLLPGDLGSLNFLNFLKHDSYFSPRRCWEGPPHSSRQTNSGEVWDFSQSYSKGSWDLSESLWCLLSCQSKEAILEQACCERISFNHSRNSRSGQWDLFRGSRRGDSALFRKMWYRWRGRCWCCSGQPSWRRIAPEERGGRISQKTASSLQ
jgi:hypothetical protein